MRSAVALGLRLARGSHGARAAAVVLTSTVGVWVVLAGLDVARAQVKRPEYLYEGKELMVLTIVATVTVPVVLLVATVARLSAVVRDRRLVNLRTLGLSPARTRLVASVEAGAGTIVGSLLGVLGHVSTRSLLPDFSVAGFETSNDHGAVWFAAAVLAVVGVPVVAALVAMVPAGRRTGPDQGRPRAWRAAPLLGGVVIAFVGASMQLYPLVIVGGVATGLGLAVLVPAITALVAGLMVRIPGRPSIRIAGRRLQSQPAGVSRVVAGLLVGLFVVTGGRVVVGAFETTPQYLAADQAIHDGPAPYEVTLDSSEGVDQLADQLSMTDGVRGAYVVRQVFAGCDEDSMSCLTGFVGTCADVVAAVPDARGCRDDRVAWLDRPDPALAGPRISWHASDSESPAGPVDTIAPADRDVITTARSDFGVSGALQAQIFIPTTAPGVVALADAGRDDTLASVAAQVDPRRLSSMDLQRAVQRIDPAASSFSQFDDTEYQFVAGLRTLVTLLAALVLAIGMLGFVVAVADRTLARRKEVVSLQLVGTPRGVIRASQGWEAAVPLMIGVLLAISAGIAIGAAYLLYLGDVDGSWPASYLVRLTSLALVAAAAVSAVTVVASAPRVRADLIRRA